ncbi:MAG: hypothetical protein IJO43_02080 [Bacilli bacterium]|nr:hypothetical protein [Bacilli bacterium]
MARDGSRYMAKKAIMSILLFYLCSTVMLLITIYEKEVYLILLIFLFIIAAIVWAIIRRKRAKKRLIEKFNKNIDFSKARVAQIKEDTHEDFYLIYDPKIKELEKIVILQIQKDNNLFSSTTFKQKGVSHFRRLQSINSKNIKSITKIDQTILNEIKNVNVVSAFIIQYQKNGNIEHIGMKITCKYKGANDSSNLSYTNYYLGLRRSVKEESNNKKLHDVECSCCGAPINITNNNACSYCGNMISADEWVLNRLSYMERGVL